MSSNRGRARVDLPRTDVAPRPLRVTQVAPDAGSAPGLPGPAAPAPGRAPSGARETSSVAARAAQGGCTAEHALRPGGSDALTPRELDVLGLMAAGASNSAVSQELHVSLKTVETYIQRIFCKLDLLENKDHNRRVKAVLIYLATP